MQGLVLVALAVGILLITLARRLRALRQTAISIAGEHFSDRVDEQETGTPRALARAFNEIETRTEALLRTQRELLQVVTHELRALLTRISFDIDLIRTSRDDNDRERQLKSLAATGLLRVSIHS